MDDCKLISLVQNCPHLFDKNRPDFKDVLKKERTWAEISRQLNLPVSDAKGRFKTLRERLVRERKNMSDIGESGIVPTTTWDLYMEMAWLLPYVGQRRKRYLTHKKSLEHELQLGYEGEEEVTVPIDSIGSYDTPMTPSSMNMDRIQNNISVDSSISASLSSIADYMKVLTVPKIKRRASEEDSDEIFGRLVASELRNSRDEKSKKLAKKQIAEILFDLQ